MKWRPILFSSEMVCAILAGRKTQTRRVMKPQPTAQVFQYCSFNGFYPALPDDEQAPNYNEEHRSPYGVTGDRLWVRETWFCHRELDEIVARDCMGSAIWYTATQEDKPADAGKIRPSIFMPRWASRIILEVVKVRVERVQDISHEDAIAEGMVYEYPVTEKTRYVSLWDSLNAKRGFGWDMNPWVWVIEFKRIK